MTHYENIQALNVLVEAGLISAKDWLRLSKKSQRLEVKAEKEARQSEVNDKVKEALDGIEEGTLFKHRQVWEAVGREAFERDEVLQSLRFWKNELEVQQVRKGDNNFQVFWCRGDEKVEEAPAPVEEVVEAPVEAS
jgi:hypothetical protein